jgi:hypothetical protein
MLERPFVMRASASGKATTEQLTRLREIEAELLFILCHVSKYGFLNSRIPYRIIAYRLPEYKSHAHCAGQTGFNGTLIYA